MTDSKKIDDGGPDLSALIDKLRNALGPVREIDALIHIAAYPDCGARMEFSPPRYVRFEDVWMKNRADHLNHANNVADWWKVPSYTASVDAAMSLARHILPGMEHELTDLYGVARVTLHHDAGPFYGSSEINSLPIAICLAALSALQSRGEA